MTISSRRHGVQQNCGVGGSRVISVIVASCSISVLAGIAGCRNAPEVAQSEVEAQKLVESIEPAPPAEPMEAFDLPIAGTSVTLKMQPIAARKAVEAFYVATTEATWDLYDAFIFNLDTDAGESTPEASDGVTRPSKPYVLADRGYGHAGYALLSASPAAVQAVSSSGCASRPGGSIRVPTEAEMQFLARGRAASPTRMRGSRPGGSRRTRSTRRRRSVRSRSMRTDCTTSGAT